MKSGNSGTSAKLRAPHARFCPLPLGAIRARGWLARQMQVEARGMSGLMDELEPDMIQNPYITRSKKDGVSTAWCAEISATYWAGLVQLAFTLDKPGLKKKAGKWVNGILAAQEPDGYLGSYRTTDNRKQDANAWGVAWAVRALMGFYEVTGRVEVLEACRRGLLWFVTHWKKHKPAYCGPMIIESLVEVFQHTGDRRLLDWAEEYMAALERQPVFPNSVSALAGPQLDYNSAHAVAYGIWLPLPAILSTANGRRDYLKASEQAARKDRFQWLTGREEEGWTRDCLHEFAQPILRHVRIQHVCQPSGRGSLCTGLSGRLLPCPIRAGPAGIRARPVPCRQIRRLGYALLRPLPHHLRAASRPAAGD